MTTIVAPLRTPSPKVRIRSQSFDSPSSRFTDTPVDESPFSKSSGSLATKALPHHDVLGASQQGILQPLNVLLPLHTKMSDESIMSDSSSAASSPIDPGEDIDIEKDSPPSSVHRQRQRPHPLTFCQSTTDNESSIDDEQPSSPFLYQDTTFPMYSPWLVRVVLDMHDVRGLDWMSIAEPVERMWGVQTNSAEVLSILSDNGRVHNRRWWD